MGGVEAPKKHAMPSDMVRRGNPEEMGVQRHRWSPQHVRVEVGDFGWFVCETNHPRDGAEVGEGVVQDDKLLDPVAVDLVGRPSRPPRSITPNSLVKRVSEETVSI